MVTPASSASLGDAAQTFDAVGLAFVVIHALAIAGEGDDVGDFVGGRGGDEVTENFLQRVVILLMVPADRDGLGALENGGSEAVFFHDRPVGGIGEVDAHQTDFGGLAAEVFDRDVAIAPAREGLLEASGGGRVCASGCAGACGDSRGKYDSGSAGHEGNGIRIGWRWRLGKFPASHPPRRRQPRSGVGQRPALLASIITRQGRMSWRVAGRRSRSPHPLSPFTPWRSGCHLPGSRFQHFAPATESYGVNVPDASRTHPLFSDSVMLRTGAADYGRSFVLPRMRHVWGAARSNGQLPPTAIERLRRRRTAVHSYFSPRRV